ncbi:MAG: glycosyltransferase [Steroidobacteraceae bacterium]
MTELNPRILFVPVSGPYGMGEYARSLAIARAVCEHWTNAEVRFVLSRAAPYAAHSPFSATLVPSSPTFHSAVVIDLIRTFRPHVVMFDNAGRAVQLKAAQRSGAHVIYISARQRQRRKAFSWRWMPLIDEHWIAYPEFLAGRLSLLERFKLRLLRGPRVRYLDVIFSRAAPGAAAEVLARAGLQGQRFVLMVPGGGTGHPGSYGAAAQFLEAGRAMAAGGVVTAFVGPAVPGAAQAPAEPDFRHLGALPQQDLMELMRHARLIVANGGSTLLQALACGAACVAVPIADDQNSRIRRCVHLGVAVEARLDARHIAARATALLGDEQVRAELARRAAGLELADGTDIAVRALGKLLEST